MGRAQELLRWAEQTRLVSWLGEQPFIQWIGRKLGWAWRHLARGYRWLKRGGPAVGALLFLTGFYLLLKLKLAWLGGWLASRDEDWFFVDKGLPSSGKETGLYMMLITIATLCYLTYDENRWQAFKRPFARFLRWKSRWRVVVLIVLPPLFGLGMFISALSGGEPQANPIRHPTPPDRFGKLQNPYRTPTDDMLAKFEAEVKSGTFKYSTGAIKVVDSTEPDVVAYKQALDSGSATPAQRATAFRRRAIEEGRFLFMKNCRPCHGTKAMGDGPMSLGLRRQPADFTGVETIATLVEGAVFWRVKRGGIKLPRIGAPWESAMPRWEEDLTDDEIWKIIMAEYDLAGNAPRVTKGGPAASTPKKKPGKNQVAPPQKTQGAPQ